MAAATRTGPVAEILTHSGHKPIMSQQIHTKLGRSESRTVVPVRRQSLHQQNNSIAFNWKSTALGGHFFLVKSEPSRVGFYTTELMKPSTLACVLLAASLVALSSSVAQAARGSTDEVHASAGRSLQGRRPTPPAHRARP